MPCCAIDDEETDEENYRGDNDDKGGDDEDDEEVDVDDVKEEDDADISKDHNIGERDNSVLQPSSEANASKVIFLCILFLDTTGHNNTIVIFFIEEA